jgi:hypothetical protein
MSRSLVAQGIPIVLRLSKTLGGAERQSTLAQLLRRSEYPDY